MHSKLRILICQNIQSIYKIFHAFSFICYFLRNEQNNFLIQRKSGSSFRLCLIYRMIQIGINRIRYVRYLLVCQQRTFPCFATQPFATSHKEYVCIIVQLLFFLKYLCRQIMGGTAVRQILAMMALRLICLTVVCVMTYTRSRPKIMHCPNHRFTTLDNIVYTPYLKKSLINPIQVYNIGFLKFTQTSYIKTGIGYIDLEQIVFGDMQMYKDKKALP